MAKIDFPRLEKIADTMVAAEHKRCACGHYGTWEDTISGTSGMQACIWASCENCTGSAIGSPVLASDMRYWENYGSEQLLVDRRVMFLASREAKEGYELTLRRPFGPIGWRVEAYDPKSQYSYTIKVDLENNTAKSVYPS